MRLPMYWYLNKQTNKPAVFTSLRALQLDTGISYEKLIYHFSRHNRSSYEDEIHRIERLESISSKRKANKND